MYNYFLIIGKCVSYDSKTNCLTVSCQRDFKDENGKYKVDEFKFDVHPTLKPMLDEIYDIENRFLSIKGRIIPIDDKCKLVADRIMFQGTYE